jgi:hypothetical protein
MPEARKVALPSIATTFRLPDDEPVVVPAQATSDANEGSEGDEDLPKVVQVASASELPEPPAADDDDADADIDASDAVADPPRSPHEDESAA